MTDFILVENLGAINTSLDRCGKLIQTGFRDELREAARPVKEDADRLSRSEISGMNRAKLDPPPWSVNRIGQTVHEVYVAPTQRGVKSRTDRSRRRPNLAPLMYGKAYEPAFAKNESQVRSSVDVWLTKIVEEV